MSKQKSKIEDIKLFRIDEYAKENYPAERASTSENHVSVYKEVRDKPVRITSTHFGRPIHYSRAA